MRKLFIVLAALFVILGILFTVLPMGTIALLPVVMALLFVLLALKNSETHQKQFPRLLFITATLTLIVIMGKELLTKDEVVADKQFDQKKIESKQEAQKDLEELE